MSKLIFIYITALLSTACNPLSATNTTFSPLSATTSESSSTVQAGTQKVQLSWGTASGIVTGYQVEQSTNGSAFTQVQQLSAVTTTTVTGLKSNTTYYFRVRAYNSGGESPYSQTATVLTGS